MRILITGSKGQLGTELQKQLALGRSELGPIPAIYQNATVIPIDIDELDLSDRAATFAELRNRSLDLVINCAAYTNVDGCETDADTAYGANALAARNLADVCEATSTKLVHVSTDYVFRGDASVPYREYDLPDPQTVYGKTKLAGENFVRERCRRHYIIRTSWLYGYNGKNFVKTILNAARQRGKVTVVNDQIGNPTSAVDLAHAILMAAAHFPTQGTHLDMTMPFFASGRWGWPILRFSGPMPRHSRLLRATCSARFCCGDFITRFSVTMCTLARCFSPWET